jgi:hypothetical protein
MADRIEEIRKRVTLEEHGVVNVSFIFCLKFLHAFEVVGLVVCIRDFVKDSLKRMDIFRQKILLIREFTTATTIHGILRSLKRY